MLATTLLLACAAQLPALPPPLDVPEARAETPQAMRPYRERIPGSEAAFDLLPIPSGTFVMGTSAARGRRDDESPAHAVAVGAFWMGRCEVTWDEYHVFMLKLDLAARQGEAAIAAEPADAVSRPTPPYVPMDFEMGVAGRPAVCMTQFAAKQYTKWLSYKTGRFYRLPTEAEWEYACRAGTNSAWSCGDDPATLAEYAWFVDNAGEKTQPVGLKKPNPFGLHDMHGNVAEWVLDAFDPRAYARRLLAGDDAVEHAARDPFVRPTTLYPRVVRGGSWDDDAKDLRSAARRPSREAWKMQDPQRPQSIWYLTDAPFVGFRVVRPFLVPPPEEWAAYWEADVEEIRRVEARQRDGER